jgi:hypothetical protein
MFPVGIRFSPEAQLGNENPGEATGVGFLEVYSPAGHVITVSHEHERI